MYEFAEKLKPGLISKLADAVEGRFETHAAIHRFERYHIVVTSLDAALGQKADGEIDGGSTVVEKK
jgi:hypothetical protein